MLLLLFHPLASPPATAVKPAVVAAVSVGRMMSR